MSWGDFAFSSGLSAVKSGVSYLQAKEQAASDRRWQRYNNAMTMIAAGQANNAVTYNENLARERSTQQGVAIRRSEFITSASVEAAAAASGTTGRSVNQVLFDVERAAAEADSNRVNDLENQQEAFQQQRQQIAQQAMTQQDLRTIPSPSLATAMLGFATDVTKQYREEKKRGSI